MATTTFNLQQEIEEGNGRVLEDVSWDDYISTLDTIEDDGLHRSVTYDNGRMSIVSPLPKHEKSKSLLGRFVEAIAEARGIPISTFGSTTWRRKAKKKGLEPDECFYITSESKVRGQFDIDLSVDPPPDLAIEVDIRRHGVARLSVYAGLGVPEVWSLHKNRIEVFALDPTREEYESQDQSVCLPFLRPSELLQFLEMYLTSDQTSVIRAVRAWAVSL